MSGGGGEQGGAMATRSSSVAHPLPAKGTVRGHTHRALHLPEPNRLLMEKQWVKSAPRGGIVMLLGMSPGLGPAVQALHGGHADLLLVVLHPVIQLLVELGEAGVMRDPIPSHCPSHPVPSSRCLGARYPPQHCSHWRCSPAVPAAAGQWQCREATSWGTLGTEGPGRDRNPHIMSPRSIPPHPNGR